MATETSVGKPAPGETTGYEDETEIDEEDLLPDDAGRRPGEKEETSTEEISTRMDRELVGLKPVNTRIREVADVPGHRPHAAQVGIESYPADAARVLHRQSGDGRDDR